MATGGDREIIMGTYMVTRRRARLRSASEPTDAVGADPPEVKRPRHRRVSLSEDAGDNDEDPKAKIVARLRTMFENVKADFLTQFVTIHFNSRLDVERNLLCMSNLLLEVKLPREEKAPGIVFSAASSSSSSSSTSAEASTCAAASAAKSVDAYVGETVWPLNSPESRDAGCAQFCEKPPSELCSYLQNPKGKKTPQDAVMSVGRPYVLKALQATFYPIKTAPLQRVCSYCGYSLTKSILVIVGALQKQSPKLLNLILHKKTISDASVVAKKPIIIDSALSLELLVRWRPSNPAYVPRQKETLGLLREITAVDKWLKSLREGSSSKPFKSVSHDDDALFECECCFHDQVKFDDLVQCREGHLFCKECVKGYAESVVGGIGKIDLQCMHDGCEVDIPPSQIQFLDEKLRKQIADRQQHEGVRLAFADPDTEELLPCPNCEVSSLIDKGNKVFECQYCGKGTCKICKADWDDDHFGRRCEEIESRDEAALRRQVEEEMTMARVRNCPGCRAPLVKNGGCNRMACRCGTLCCYLCRERIDKEGYDHFCRHLLQPGHGCTECKKCLLFRSAEAEDREKLSEIRAKGEDEWSQRGYTDGKKLATELSPLPPPRPAAAAVAPPPPPPPAPLLAAGGPLPVAQVAPGDYLAQGARPRVRRA